MLRWLRRIVLAVVGIGVVAIGALAIALHTSWGREQLRARAERALADSFPGSHIGGLEGSVFGTLVVRDIAIAGADGRAMATIGELDIEVALLPLLAKQVRIDRLAVDDVTIVTTPPASAEGNAGEAGGATSWSLAFDHVEVRRAKIVTSTGDVELGHFELDASIQAPAGQALVALVRARAEWRDRPLRVVGLVRHMRGDTVVPFAAAMLGDDDPMRVLALAARVADTGAIEGSVTAHVPARVIGELAAIAAAGDVSAFATAHGDGDVDVRAAYGGADLHAMLRADVAHRSARGLVVAHAADVAELVRGELSGRATVIAALEIDQTSARGLVTVKGTRSGHDAIGLVAVDATRTGAWTLGELASDLGGARATVVAQLARKGDAIELAHATLSGHARELVVAAGATRAAARLVEARVAAKGTLWPVLDVRGDATVDATGLAGAGFHAAQLTIRADAARANAAGVKARVQIDLDRAETDSGPLGSASIDTRAALARDGGIEVDLDAHRLATAAAGTWSGTSGHLAVRDGAVTLDGFTTTNGAGEVVVGGRYEPATGDTSARARARGIAVAGLVPGGAGTLAAQIGVARRAGVWDATGQLDGSGVIIAPGRPAFDTTATLALHGRRFDASAVATNAAIGRVRAEVALDAPRDLTRVAAWRQLERRAIRSATFELTAVQLGGLDPALGGAIDGSVDLTASDVHGELRVRGLPVPGGALDADVTLAPGEHAAIAAGVAAQLVGIASAGATAELAMPAHLLDPEAWRALGRGVLAGASVHAHEIAFDPEVLAKLGIVSPYRGTLDVSSEIASGLASVTTQLSLHGLAGGVLARAVDLDLVSKIDTRETQARGTAATGPTQIVAFEAHTPVGLDALLALDRAHLAGVLSAPLDGTVALPPATGSPATLSARDLLSTFGRDEVLSGTLSGQIELGGTLGVPTGRASLEVRDVAIRASVEGRPPARLADLSIAARWLGDSGSLELIANEPGGGKLSVSAHGRPRLLDSLMASVDADKFDLAPISAFAPGVFGAARGVLDGSLALEGFDPDTGKLRGKLHVHDGRLPLHDLIGTLRKADVAIDVRDRTVTAKLTGRLGRGDVTGAATVALAGSTPRTLDATLALRQISLIRAHQPVIDADISTHLEHSDRWTGRTTIDHAHVVVPSSGAVALLEAQTPSDMMFVDAPPPKATPLLHRPPPTHPWLVTRVALHTASIDVEDDEYQALGRVAGEVVVAVGGDAIGMDGTIEGERGDIELLGQRSQLDHGSVIFDGTLDPVLDVRVTRDLDTMTVYADVAGRASKPEVTFSSDTGSYSQGDLLAYFVGGQPGGDRTEVSQAAAAASAGYASKLLSKKLNKLLPIKLNLDFRYEAATAVNSEAVGLGRWLNSDTYVEARQHIEARPDENVNEGVLEYHWSLLGNSLFRASIGDQGYDSGEIEWRWHW
jgi:translocation and assembly module TamB